MNMHQLEALQREENKKQCDALKSAGDQSEVLHPVIHKLEFISEYKRRDLVEELEERGFQITEDFTTEEGYNGFIFQRPDSVTYENMEKLTLSLLVLLDEYDARYGGWTTEVITA